MTVQPKLGRWRTRGGQMAVVERTTGNPLMPWAGWVDTSCGALSRTWMGDGSYGSRHMHDLVEYVGALDAIDEPAPFDLAAFIAGLKPGDYYRQNDGGRGRFIARDGEVIGVRADTGAYHWLDNSPDARSFAKFPAGPWVEPPKVIDAGTLAACDWNGRTVFHIHAAGDNPGECLFAQRITYTPGKGFELGEVIKQ